MHNGTGVGDLPTRFHIERSGGQYQLNLFSFARLIDCLPVPDDGHQVTLHLGVAVRVVVYP